MSTTLMRAPVAALPKIIRFTGMSDSGPTDGGRDCTFCPHCGSKGRYIWYFLCDDGTKRGAMSGCVQLFPVSEIAATDRYLMDKEAELRKAYGPDAHLNSWSQKMRDAIDAFYTDTATEADTLNTIRREKASQAAYRQRKYKR